MAYLYDQKIAFLSAFLRRVQDGKIMIYFEMLKILKRLLMGPSNNFESERRPQGLKVAMVHDSLITADGKSNHY